MHRGRALALSCVVLVWGCIHDRGTIVHDTASYDAVRACLEGNCEDGDGVAEYADGKTYVGGFRMGSPHGAGIMRWPNGDQYVGTFKFGRKHGVGASTTSGKTIRQSWYMDEDATTARKDLESRIYAESALRGDGGFQWGKFAALAAGGYLGGLGEADLETQARILSSMLADSMEGTTGTQNLESTAAGLVSTRSPMTEMEHRHREYEARIDEISREGQAKRHPQDAMPGASQVSGGDRQSSSARTGEPPLAPTGTLGEEASTPTPRRRAESGSRPSQQGGESATEGRAVPSCLSTHEEGERLYLTNTCPHWISVAYCSEDVGISGKLCGQVDSYYTHMKQLGPNERDYVYDKGKVKTAVCEGYINSWDPKKVQRFFESDSTGRYRCPELPTFTPSR